MGAAVSWRRGLLEIFARLGSSSKPLPIVMGICELCERRTAVIPCPSMLCTVAAVCAECLWQHVRGECPVSESEAVQ